MASAVEDEIRIPNAAAKRFSFEIEDRIPSDEEH
jgi:hypothetical protein